MSKVLREVLREAIENKRRELEQLEADLRRIEREDSQGGQKTSRRRKKTGIKADSVPGIAQTILKEHRAPMSAAELADKVGEKTGKPVETRVLAAALKRYIDDNRFFKRTPDGMYEVIREQ